MERHRTELSTKKESRERVHVITSRDPARADLAQLAGYIRGHWGIVMSSIGVSTRSVSHHCGARGE